MTVSTAYSATTYSGNGSTTAFPTLWPFFSASDLVVTDIVDATGVETTKTLTTHYTVSGGTDSNGLPATGTVTMLTAPASGHTLKITRVTPKTQATAWNEGDAFAEKSVEATLDRAMLIAQEVAERQDRIDVYDTATVDIGTVTTGAAGSSASATLTGEYPDYTLNLTIPRGDTGLSGNGTGDVIGPSSSTNNALVLFDGTGGKTIKDSTYTISAAGASLIDDASTTAMLATLGITAGYAGTSVTSLTIGTGSKTLTTQAGLSYVVGSRVRVASSADPTKYMEGIITAYSTTSMTFTSDKTGGSGTIASWNLSIGGTAGSDGASFPNDGTSIGSFLFGYVSSTQVVGSTDTMGIVSVTGCMSNTQRVALGVAFASTFTGTWTLRSWTVDGVGLWQRTS